MKLVDAPESRTNILLSLVFHDNSPVEYKLLKKPDDSFSYRSTEFETSVATRCVLSYLSGSNFSSNQEYPIFGNVNIIGSTQ